MERGCLCKGVDLNYNVLVPFSLTLSTFTWHVRSPTKTDLHVDQSSWNWAIWSPHAPVTLMYWQQSFKKTGCYRIYSTLWPPIYEALFCYLIAMRRGSAYLCCQEAACTQQNCHIVLMSVKSVCSSEAGRHRKSETHTLRRVNELLYLKGIIQICRRTIGRAGEPLNVHTPNPQQWGELLLFYNWRFISYYQEICGNYISKQKCRNDLSW